MKGQIYELTYLKKTDEFYIRPWGMKIYLNREEMIRDLENVLSFIKNINLEESVINDKKEI